MAGASVNTTPTADTTTITAPILAETDLSKQLKAKNMNILLASSGISLLGNVAGLVYAIQTKKSGWGKVGWFFLGGIIVGVPSGIIARSMILKNLEKIQKERKTTYAEAAENKYFKEGGGFR